MWVNGESYVGEWKEDKMDGRGVFRTLEGEEIAGEFKDDKKIRD